jgi:hypothetical protein
MMNKQTAWYHAGALASDGVSVRWSSHSRRSREAAEREAVAMARRDGATPIVESWPLGLGPRPGDAGVVSSAWEVTT